MLKYIVPKNLRAIKQVLALFQQMAFLPVEPERKIHHQWLRVVYRGNKTFRIAVTGRCIPYYRKLTLVLIKVFEINAT